MQDQKIGGITRLIGYLGMIAMIAWFGRRVRHDVAARKTDEGLQ